MLTISAPIEIKAKTSYIHDPEAFYHRITGGYSLMETHIEQEDLLHITSTPPEIYVAEGEGMTSIIANNQRNETNISKVNILNNVLNRILLSADVGLTYQDRVFITDALYKLGIRDDRRFMEAFYQMASETRNTNTLVNLYLESGGQLMEVVEELEIRQKELTRSVSQIREKEKENYLYNTVMNRLKTGAIYQIVSNFNRSVEFGEVDAREYSIANQTYMAQNILLTKLRTMAGTPGEDLVFFNSNVYEESVENENTQLSSIRNEITAAVMLDLLKNIYHTAYDKFYESSDIYYRFEDTFFKSSDQTFLRLITNAHTTLLQEMEERVLIEETKELTNTEIELLESGSSDQITDEELRRLTETVDRINIVNEKRRQHYVEEIQKIRENYPEPPRTEVGLKRTRKDAALALSDPAKLMEQLQEQSEKRTIRQSTIINELQHIFPEQSMEVYQILSNLREGDVNLIENNIIRHADVGELMYDINTATEPSPEEKKQEKKKTRQAEEFLEAIKVARQEEEAKKKASKERGPAQTIHRRTETITAEELTEQLDLLQKNFSRNINKTQSSDVMTTNKNEQVTEVVNNESRVNQISAKDIQDLIDINMKNQMKTMSNQIMGKIERQMKNEKMRRGY